MIRRPHGFPGEVLWLTGQDFEKIAGNDPLAGQLFPTDLGYFPKAEGHFRSRIHGCDQEILIICLDGEGFYQIKNDPPQKIGAGSLLYIPHGLSHSYGASEINPWSILWVHFRGNWVKELCPIHFYTRIVGPDTLLRVQDLFSDLFNWSARPDRDIWLRPLSSALVWLVTLALQPEIDKKGGASSPVDLAITYMSSHLDKPLTLEDLSQIAGMSVGRLSVVFKNKTGHSPIEHFVRLRIQKACSLLENRNRSITEISRIVGYEDPLHFSRVFHRITGHSPRSWRAEGPG